MSRILITGASGFVGQHLAPALGRAGHDLTLATNRPCANLVEGARVVVTGPLESAANLDAALQDADAVVHLAGLASAHSSANGANPYIAANEVATKRLAEAASLAGVRKFINLSSIVAATDNASTQIVGDLARSSASTPYGRSKLAAEQHVEALGQSGVFAVSLRPPQVIGANARGTWGMLQRLAASVLPLPFASVKNQRSYISIATLIQAVAHLTDRDWAPSKSGSYALADPDTLSLPGVIGELRHGMGKSARLAPFPASFISAVARALGQQQKAAGILGDLRVDPSRFFDTFDFTPSTPLRQAIRESGRDYLLRSRP